MQHALEVSLRTPTFDERISEPLFYLYASFFKIFNSFRQTKIEFKS